MVSSLRMSQHRGEIIEAAIRKSGYSITNLAKKIGKSRRWMYLMFDNPNVSLDYVIRIGYLINHDFSEEIDKLRPFNQDEVKEAPASYHKDMMDAAYWREKYFELLEEYHQLTKRFNS